MDLWIRSQERDKLIKAGHLYIQENIKQVEGWSILNDMSYIGEYETKERALEVLDEIQNILNKGYVLGKEEYNETSGCYYEPQNNVFEMPKE